MSFIKRLYLSKSICLHCILLISLCLFSFKAITINDINLSITELDSIETPFLKIKDIELSLSFETLQQIQIHLSSKNIKTDFIEDIHSISVDCLIDVFENSQLECKKGSLTLFQGKSKQKSNISFIYDLNKGLKKFSVNNLHLFSGSQSITAKKNKQLWNASLSIKDTSIENILASLNHYQDYKDEFPIQQGLLNLSTNITLMHEEIISLKINGSIDNLFLDAAQVLEDVSLETNFSLKKKKNYWLVENQTNFTQGAMYLTPGFTVFENQPGFFFDLTNEPINIHFSANSSLDHKQIDLHHFSFVHENHITATGKGLFDLSTDYLTESTHFQVSTNDLAKVYPVYIEPILLPTNYSDLMTQGSMSIDIQHEKEELKYLNLLLNDLSIFDERKRFGIEKLNSNIQMQDSKSTNISNITWQALSIYKLPFGPADMTFESISNNYTLTNWQSVTLLDGGLDIKTLKLDNIGATDFKLSLGGALKPISLTQFTEAMSWPTMAGTLEGKIEGVEYTNNNLEILGDIDFKAFDGDIYLHGVKIENLFSTNSRLTSNLELTNLDIEILTDTFTFGKMEGTLNGYMNDFTLENWQPVYFDAKFETPKDDQRPHRISQKALENISEIGGGIGSSLSSSLLRFVPSYSYGQFGISCRLEKGVCNLGGVKDTENGFYILTQGGLLPPWVDVMGSGRSILWDNLIEGIQQISEGEVQFE